jgi:hypothetical protein
MALDNYIYSTSKQLTMIISTNKRSLLDADYDRNAKIQRVDDIALPQWLRVERAVFLIPELFGCNVTLLLHWDEMSFNQFMAVGFIETYPEARQFRIEMSKASPAQQFGFDGAVFIDGKWSPVQVKDHRKRISPNDFRGREEKRGIDSEESSQ